MRQFGSQNIWLFDSVCWFDLLFSFSQPIYYGMNRYTYHKQRDYHVTVVLALLKATIIGMKVLCACSARQWSLLQSLIFFESTGVIWFSFEQGLVLEVIKVACLLELFNY